MDPEELLQRIEDAIKEYDIRGAMNAAEEYAEWRTKGGFEPPNGDAVWKRVCSMLDLIEDICDKFIARGRFDPRVIRVVKD